jgi:hypothetical protein
MKEDKKKICKEEDKGGKNLKQNIGSMDAQPPKKIVWFCGLCD